MKQLILRGEDIVYTWVAVKPTTRSNYRGIDTQKSIKIIDLPIIFYYSRPTLKL